MREPRWQDEPTEIDPTRDYRPWELEAIADRLIRWARAAEACPTCGAVEIDPQADPTCAEGHAWSRGEGTREGHKDDAVLLDTQLTERYKREVYVGEGIPDPAFESGIFHRPHRPSHRAHERNTEQ